MGNLDLFKDTELKNFCEWFQQHYGKSKCYEGGLQIAMAGHFHIHVRIAAKLIERCLLLGFISKRNGLITFNV